MNISAINGASYAPQRAAVQPYQARQVKTDDGDGDKDGKARGVSGADADGDSKRLLNTEA